MKQNLTELDHKFSNHFKQLFEIQRELIEKYKSYEFDLDKTEITRAIHNRMSAFWYFNVHNTKELLRANITPPASDFFTQTCMLFFKVYFEQRYEVLVCSEKSIVPGKKLVRPDITIWSKNEVKLLASIELKVNNGWKKKEIKAHLEEREKKVKDASDGAYFGVIAFWNFFEKVEPEWKNKYVGLYEFNDNKNHPETGAYVEDIMKQIEQNIRCYKI